MRHVLGFFLFFPNFFSFFFSSFDIFFLEFFFVILFLLRQLIRGNGGAVSAEQLAPLLSPGNPRPDDSRVDESFMLPVMTALGGVPEVKVYARIPRFDVLG